MTRHLKKQVLLLVFFPFSLFAADGKIIIQRMIETMRRDANVAHYEMTIQRPAWSRSVRLKAWDDRKHERFFVRILEPPKDAGTSFLRIRYNLWNYLPKVEKVLKIPPSMMLQSWMGSDFSNDDLVKESSYVEDYDHRIVGTEVRAGEKVQQIELTPHSEAPVVWGKVIYWVRIKDTLPVEQHFLDEKGTLIKKLEFKEFKVMDGRMTPTFWEMTPVKKAGHRTTLRMLEADFDPAPPIPASVFTEQNLRS